MTTNLKLEDRTMTKTFNESHWRCDCCGYVLDKPQDETTLGYNCQRCHKGQLKPMTTKPTHTAGLLKAATQEMTGRRYLLADEGEDGHFLTWIDDGSKLDIDRLIACWNECATIPTADLHKIQALPELEEALKAMQDAMSLYLNEGTGRYFVKQCDGEKVDHVLHSAVKIAKAALAKLEKE